MPKQPQDHQSPAGADQFRFVGADGKSHILPDGSDAQDNLTGRQIRDAALGGEAGMMALMFLTLEAANPSDKALNALYDLPGSKMMDVLKAWGEHSGTSGVSLGESSGSPD